MVKDPVCGMSVSEGSAKANLVHQGRTYYFCSAFCKQMFEREPEKYVPPAKNGEEKSLS